MKIKPPGVSRHLPGRILCAIALLCLLAHPSRAADQSSPEAAVGEIVRSWNSAVAARNTEPLSNLYTEEMNYYGRTIPRDEAVAAKQRFFADNPTFTQSIVGEIRVKKEDVAGRGYTARFNKLVVIGGKKTSYPSYLVVDSFPREGDEQVREWRIVIESDEVTDANLIRSKRSFDPKQFKRCSDVVLGIFKSAPNIRSEIVSTSILEIDSEDEGVYTLHLYEVPPLAGMDQTAGWYEFNLKTRALVDTMSGDELRYDRKLLSYLKRFCGS